jgi:hypothetical protein
MFAPWIRTTSVAGGVLPTDAAMLIPLTPAGAVNVASKYFHVFATTATLLALVLVYAPPVFQLRFSPIVRDVAQRIQPEMTYWLPAMAGTPVQYAFGVAETPSGVNCKAHPL